MKRVFIDLTKDDDDDDYADKWVQDYLRKMESFSKPLTIVDDNDNGDAQATIVIRGAPVFTTPSTWRHFDLWVCNGFESTRRIGKGLHVSMTVRQRYENILQLVPLVTLKLMKGNTCVQERTCESLGDVMQVFKALKKHWEQRYTCKPRGTKSVWNFFGVSGNEMESYIRQQEEQWCKRESAVRNVLSALGLDLNDLMTSQPRLLF